MLQRNKIDSLQELTTTNGFKQISNDFEKSMNDPRMKLLVFGAKDITNIIPVKIQFTRDIDGIGCINFNFLLINFESKFFFLHIKKRIVAPSIHLLLLFDLSMI